MIIKNKLDKPFGPFGTATGFFMFLGGIIATYFSLFGLIIAFIGAFVAFTTTSTIVDTDNKKIMPIKKCDSYESSGNELDDLRSLLGLEIIRAKT